MSEGSIGFIWADVYLVTILFMSSIVPECDIKKMLKHFAISNTFQCFQCFLCFALSFVDYNDDVFRNTRWSQSTNIRERHRIAIVFTLPHANNRQWCLWPFFKVYNSIPKLLSDHSSSQPELPPSHYPIFISQCFSIYIKIHSNTNAPCSRSRSPPFCFTTHTNHIVDINLQALGASVITTSNYHTSLLSPLINQSQPMTSNGVASPLGFTLKWW